MRKHNYRLEFDSVDTKILAVITRVRILPEDCSTPAKRCLNTNGFKIYTCPCSGQCFVKKFQSHLLVDISRELGGCMCTSSINGCNTRVTLTIIQSSSKWNLKHFRCHKLSGSPLILLWWPCDATSAKVFSRRWPFIHEMYELMAWTCINAWHACMHVRINAWKVWTHDMYECMCMESMNVMNAWMHVCMNACKNECMACKYECMACMNAMKVWTHVMYECMYEWSNAW